MSKRRRAGKPTRPRPPASGQPPPRVPAALETASAGTARDSDVDAGAAHSLVGWIATGRLDDHLGALTAAITQRQNHRLRAASHQAAALLAIGDRVRIGHTIRPLYLHGATGTVVGWAGQRAVVRLDAPTGRAISGEVRCPPLGLEVLAT